MKFGDNLKKLRKQKNISQEDLAEKVGVSRQSVSKWECYEAYPEMNNILALCTIFNCKINDLVHEDFEDIDSLDKEIKMSVVKFKNDKQQQMKILTKAVYIISKIGKICVSIGAWTLIVMMIALPFVAKDVKVTNNNVKVLNETFEYTIFEDKIEFMQNGKKEVVYGEKRVETISNMIETFENKSSALVIGYVEVVILFLTGGLVILYFTLKHMEQLFDNIHDGETPFTIDNVNHIKRMSYLLIALLIVPGIGAVIADIAFGETLGLGFEGVDLLYILFLFSMSYIFEYGYEIQKDSKGIMYK